MVYKKLIMKNCKISGEHKDMKAYLFHSNLITNGGSEF